MEICAPFSQNHNQQKQERNHQYTNLPHKKNRNHKRPKYKESFDCWQGLTDKYRSCDADEVLHKTDLGNDMPWKSSLFSLFSAIFSLSLPSNLSLIFHFCLRPALLAQSFEVGPFRVSSKMTRRLVSVVYWTRIERSHLIV